MATYMIRFREIQVSDIEVSGENYKEACRKFQEKLPTYDLGESVLCGVRFEIETIQLLGEYDRQTKRKLCNEKPPPTRTRKPDTVNDCESRAD